MDIINPPPVKEEKRIGRTPRYSRKAMEEQKRIEEANKIPEGIQELPPELQAKVEEALKQQAEVIQPEQVLVAPLGNS